MAGKRGHYKGYRQTERKIRRAVNWLFSRSPGRVNARDAARKAGISPQTFYAHHKDTSDALSSTNASLEKELRKVLRKLEGRELGERQLYLQLALFLYANKEQLADQDLALTRGFLKGMLSSARPLAPFKWPNYGGGFKEAADEVYAELLSAVLMDWVYKAGCDVRRMDDCVDVLARTRKLVARAIVETGLLRLRG